MRNSKQKPSPSSESPTAKAAEKKPDSTAKAAEPNVTALGLAIGTLEKEAAKLLDSVDDGGVSLSIRKTSDSVIYDCRELNKGAVRSIKIAEG